jgi:hypothetical protein
MNMFIKIICFFIIINICLYSFIVLGNSFITFEFSPDIYNIGRWHENSRLTYLVIITVANVLYAQSIYLIAMHNFKIIETLKERIKYGN